MLNEEDEEIKFIIEEFRNYGKNFNNSYNLVSDKQIKLLKEFISDFAELTEKSTKIDIFFDVRYIFLNLMTAITIDPICLEEIEILISEYLKPRIIKSIMNLDEHLEKVKKFIPDDVFFNDKFGLLTKEKEYLNLFEPDGRQLTIDDLINEKG